MQGELVEPTTAPTEEEAERYYIDALTKLILEATDLSEKERLNQRLGLFLKNRNYYSKRIETSH